MRKAQFFSPDIHTCAIILAFLVVVVIIHTERKTYGVCSSEHYHCSAASNCHFSLFFLSLNFSQNAPSIKTPVQSYHHRQYNHFCLFRFHPKVCLCFFKTLHLIQDKHVISSIVACVAKSEKSYNIYKYIPFVVFCCQHKENMYAYLYVHKNNNLFPTCSFPFIIFPFAHPLLQSHPRRRRRQFLLFL